MQNTYSLQLNILAKWIALCFPAVLEHLDKRIFFGSSFNVFMSFRDNLKSSQQGRTANTHKVFEK
jgi:hypothetical protein